MRLKSDAINAGFHITLGAITRTSAKNSPARAAARQKSTDGGWENTERGKSPSVCRRQTLLTMAVRLWSLGRKKKKDESAARRERLEGAERGSKAEESAIEAVGKRRQGGGVGGMREIKNEGRGVRE